MPSSSARPRRLRLNVRGGRTLATPLLWIGSQNGAVPHLTRDALDLVFPSSSSFPLMAPFAHLLGCQPAVKKMGKGLATFLGLPAETPVLLTPMDPTLADRPGFHRNKDVSMWRGSNRESVDPDQYMDGVVAAQPDIFVSLCDGETPKDCSKKRVSKSVSKSLDFLDKCLQIKTSQSATLANSLVFGAVQGGYDKQARAFSAKETAARPVDGFLLDGFHSNGQAGLDVDLGEVAALLRDVVLPPLPEDKPRLWQGACDPEMLLTLVELGVDLFESSYPFLMAEEGRALVFPNSLSGGAGQVNESLPVKVGGGGPQEEEAAPGDGPQEEAAAPAAAAAAPKQPSRHDAYTINLKDARFKEDFGPLSSDCSCFVCRKHTRAYVNHLLATSELVGPKLLMMHNLSHYRAFFDAIGSCLERGELHLLKERVLGGRRSS